MHVSVNQASFMFVCVCTERKASQGGDVYALTHAAGSRHCVIMNMCGLCAMVTRLEIAPSKADFSSRNKYFVSEYRHFFVIREKFLKDLLEGAYR